MKKINDIALKTILTMGMITMTFTAIQIAATPDAWLPVRIVCGLGVIGFIDAVFQVWRRL